MIKRPARRKSIKLRRNQKSARPLIGWREWAVLPDLDISKIKVKIDTGARTSSLHAFDVVVGRRHGKDIVRFKVHPLQRNNRKVMDCEAELIEWRAVTDSGGKRTLRPVIETRIMLGAREVLAEVTLIARDEMGFRMLIGRQAITGVWIVDPASSFVAADDLMMVRSETRFRAMNEEE